MRKLWMLAVGAALLVGASAQAGTSEASSDLLSQATAGKAVAAQPLTVAQLSEVRGEGTISRFIEIPNLARDFENIRDADGLHIEIIGVAGQGISISISGDRIPNLP